MLLFVSNHTFGCLLSGMIHEILMKCCCFSRGGTTTSTFHRSWWWWATWGFCEIFRRSTWSEGSEFVIITWEASSHDPFSSATAAWQWYGL